MADFSRFGGRSAEWRSVEATLPTPPEMSRNTLRKVTNDTREAASATVMEQLVSQVVTHDPEVPARDGATVKARTYRPSSRQSSEALPIYIHFHGGGFFFGTLDSENATCAGIAIETEVLVVNINYRHAPEHPYPTPYDDAEDALGWVRQHAEQLGGDANKIVVGGISAGGGLTASLMQTLHRRNKLHGVLGQVLMIPVVVHEDNAEQLFRQLKDPAQSSYVENEFAPVLPMTRMRMFNSLLHQRAPQSTDLRLNPSLAPSEDLKGLPPAVFGVCGLDPLRDEALLYASALHESGVPSHVSIFKGVPHGFRRFGDKLTASRAWDKVMHNGIRWCIDSPVHAEAVRYHIYEDSVDPIVE